MTILYRLRAWVLWTLRRRRIERDLDEELHDYVALSAADKVRQGHTPEQARRDALLDLGGLEQARERVRAVRSAFLVDAVWKDAKFAVRTLYRSRTFACVIVLTVALGIGANTVLFSLVDAALFRPLQVEQPGQLVRFDTLFEQGNPMIREFSGDQFAVPGSNLRSGASLPYNVYEAFRRRGDTLSSVLAFAPAGRVTLTIDNGLADVVYSEVVSGTYFPTLGVAAEPGRTIGESDDLATAEPVAVLAHSYWEDRLGSDPDVIGSTVRINGFPVTVIGVAESGFHSAMGFAADPVAVFLPLAAQDDIWGISFVDRPWGMKLRMMARMRPGVTPEQVAGELGGIFQATVRDGWIAALADASEPIPSEVPATPRLRVRPGGRGILDLSMDQVRQLLLVLSMVFGLVLGVVCLNVANLLTARGAARNHEIAVRMGLGASRGRIVCQLLTESILLAAIGGVLGTLLAFQGRDVFRLLLPGTINIVLDLRIDWRVLAFSFAATLLTGVLFGLLPALHARRTRPAWNLKQQSPGRTRSRRRLAQTLVTTEIATSLVLVMAAGFFMKTLSNLSDMDFGFDTRNLLLFQADLRMLPPGTGRSIEVYEAMVQEISTLPGVAGVTTSSLPLVSLRQQQAGISLASDPDPSRPRGTDWVTVRHNYFATIGVPIVNGRDFDATDDEDAPAVALVNEILARQLFSDGDAVGQRIGFRDREVQIVGVVRDVQGIRATEPRRGFLYTNDRQFDLAGRTFQIRTSVEPSSIANSVREAVRRIDPDIAVFDLKTQEQQVQESFVIQRIIAGSSSFFGGVAVLLAAVGLYGVLSFSVAQQARDVGIRMALGADKRRVIGSVFREAAWPVGIGVPAGLIAGVALGRIAEALLYGLTPSDPVIIGMSVALMLLTAAVGTYLPAQRAASVDPLVALRYD